MDDSSGSHALLPINTFTVQYAMTSCINSSICSSWASYIFFPVFLAMVVVEQNLLLSDLVARNRDVVPIQYVRPISERPNLGEVIASDKSDIPIVDLQGIDGPGRTSVVEAIGLACQSDGFFQVLARYNVSIFM